MVLFDSNVSTVSTMETEGSGAEVLKEEEIKSLEWNAQEREEKRGTKLHSEPSCAKGVCGVIYIQKHPGWHIAHPSDCPPTTILSL